MKCTFVVLIAACGRFGFGPLPVDAPAPDLELCGDTSGLSSTAPWPVMHGCPTNAGRSRFAGPATGATAMAPHGSITGQRGAAVAGGNQIFIEQGGPGAIFAFDGESGGQPWTFTDSAGSGFEPFVAIDDRGVLFETTNYGMIWSVDPSTGKSLWHLQLAGAFSAPMIGAPGVMYFGSMAPWGFYAVDTVGRAQKWHYDIPNGGDTRTAPALGGGRVYFIDAANSRLFALDAATGGHVFDVPIAGTAVGSPVLGVDTVYVATMTDGIAALDPQSGEARWQEPAGEPAVQPALLATGDLVSSTPDGIAYVLDREDGARRYAWPVGGRVLAPPKIDLDDAAYFATDRGTVAFTKRSLLWQSDLSGGIAIANQAVVVTPAMQTVAMIGP